MIPKGVANRSGGYRMPCDRGAVTVGNEVPIWRSQNPGTTTASATCHPKPTCSCSFAADTSVRLCSSVCSRDVMDRDSGERWRETPRLPAQSRCRTTWTAGTIVDDGLLTHNPEVAGSNPAPATSLRSSRPFPDRERAFGVPGSVVKRVPRTGFARSGSETGWHGMRQPGRGGRCRR